ncbi:E3 ubiquitin-protein ligase MARCHF6 isoform X3 [Procambarus clarkii]|uniref:E3 ubiquitin-protein ligase MARCHF6 isoform X3 n=1 Tax=Procambarus clarkii TaxID=6728 RepID=UPI001E670C8E|nr:E3 ubiquitin-protein ligase MARCHF6-like isoform X3 [Procambarus clarkii]
MDTIQDWMWQLEMSDICRVCRCEGTSDRPLFHPCICTGSIKFIHQDCLVQWLRYSRKEYCELCKHRFHFTPIYSPDMPKRLPIADILSGLARSMGTAVRYWLHYTLVAVAWLGVVPLTACRIYRCLFTGSVSSVLTLPLDMLSTDNLVSDIFHGCFVVTCTLSAFISLVWLREQILHGGGPDWLDQDVQHEHEPPGNFGLLNQGNGQVPVQPANENAAAPIEAANNNAEIIEHPAHQEIAPVPVIPNMAEGNEGELLHEGVPANNNLDPGAAADDLNWNPIEWDRAAEELTWERLLGLDGSLVFLEHVFWVVSLNTMFILVFAFCPYHIGHFTIVGFKLKSWVSASHFEGLLTALCGYCVVGLCLVLLHTLAAIIRLNRSKRVLGLCYVVVKVALLSVVEIGVFPLIGGWWLDICSLSLFDATLKDREVSFKAAPGTSMFIHWLVGMVYVFYFASFILLLREVLRPGVLWFLRNLNDPDFNPVQEMIHLPIVRHTRRFLASMVIFGSTVLLMLWLPIKIIHGLWPSFLPYHITLSSDTPVSELSLELLLLQVILPALLEQGHTRVWLKLLVRHWCAAVSHVLGLRSYLLGDVALDAQGGGVVIGGDTGGGVGEAAAGAEIVPQAEPEGPVEGIVNPVVGGGNDGGGAGGAGGAAAGGGAVAGGAAGGGAAGGGGGAGGGAADALAGGLGAAHQALLQRDGPTGFQAYVRPRWFGVRILGLVVMMCISLTAASIMCLTLPVLVGRQCMYLALGDTKATTLYPDTSGSRLSEELVSEKPAAPSQIVHELYTGACGLYLCLLGIRGITLLASWIMLGWTQVIVRLRQWGIMGTKAVIALVVVAVVVPLMVGVLMELVIVIPLRVPLHQTPILFLWQDWALGVLYTKIMCALVMMGPNWWLKTNLEHIYLGGVRGLDLNLLVGQTALPVIACLGACLTVPYVTAHTIAPLVAPPSALILVERRIYPALLIITLLSSLIIMQVVQFTRLYEHIKNDKYLVGRRLVNYDHTSSQPPPLLPENEVTPFVR